MLKGWSLLNKYCRAIDDILRCFDRREHERSGGRGGGVYGSTDTELDSSLTLTDRVGQKLEVLLENHLGEGGQRHVIAYCPMWMVNTSHYRLRYSLGAT